MTRTSWGRTCTSERPRVETHRDEQREAYEDAVDRSRREDDERDENEPRSRRRRVAS